jgi:DNA-directed RNA polymerase subunit E'/Rpb7
MACLLRVGSDNTEIPTLAERIPLQQLSAKRVTVAVRQALRDKYEGSVVEVSCSAVLRMGTIWTGRCQLDGQDSTYQVWPLPLPVD